MEFWKRISNKFSRPPAAPARADLYAVMQDAYALLVAEEYEKARPVLLKALEFGDSIHDVTTVDWILTGLGMTWLFQDRFQEQIAFFSGYLRQYPREWIAFRERAGALWYSGQLREAVSDYTRALELEPMDLVSRSGRRQVLADLGEGAKAMEDLEIALRIIETAPGPSDAHREILRAQEAFVRNGRAVALAGMAQIQESRDEFDASIALWPENAWVYYNRAKVSEKNGNLDGALSDYRTSLEKTKPHLTPGQKESSIRKIESNSQTGH